MHTNILTTFHTKLPCRCFVAKLLRSWHITSTMSSLAQSEKTLARFLYVAVGQRFDFHLRNMASLNKEIPYIIMLHKYSTHVEFSQALFCKLSYTTNHHACVLDANGSFDFQVCTCKVTLAIDTSVNRHILLYRISTVSDGGGLSVATCFDDGFVPRPYSSVRNLFPSS